MDACIFLLIIIPSATALVDCRTACQTCRRYDEGIDAKAFEVFCTMCQECKERHKQQRLQRQNTVVGSEIEGVTVNLQFSPNQEQNQMQPNLQQNQFPPNVQRTQFLPIEAPPQLPPNPEPILEHYAEVLDIPEGCPTPPPCDDEVTNPYTTKGLAISPKPTTTSTTTSTTTTTTRPCPTFSPCRPKTVRPPYIFIPPPPQMIIPPPMPVQTCYMQPMPPIQPYPAYHYAPAPMPYAQGPMHPGFMKSYCPLTQGPLNQNNTFPDNNPREEVIVNQSDQAQDHTGMAPASGEDFGTDVTKKTRIPSVRKNLPSNYDSKKDKDFVYVYIGVPKQVLQD